MMQLALLIALIPWGIFASIVLLVVAPTVGAIPFIGVPSIRGFWSATLLIIALVSSMWFGAQFLLHFGCVPRTAYLFVATHPIAIGFIGIRQELRAGASVSLGGLK
jgi:hypothetical protein